MPVNKLDGVLYWVTGLSGAGKTTIAYKLYAELIKDRPTILLDGDKLREVFMDSQDYSMKDRLNVAMRNSRLCKLLVDQNITVVCATISMFHKCRDWNRKNITNYREIYLKVPIDELIRRDPKNIYKDSITSGRQVEVVGLNGNIEEPIAPDLLINNYGSIDADIAVRKILFLGET